MNNLGLSFMVVSLVVAEIAVWFGFKYLTLFILGDPKDYNDPPNDNDKTFMATLSMFVSMGAIMFIPLLFFIYGGDAIFSNKTYTEIVNPKNAVVLALIVGVYCFTSSIFLVKQDRRLGQENSN